MESKKIIIIGGGIGGLALGQGLKKLGVPFTIFERDLSEHARSQGYRLRIHQWGADALQKVCPEETWNLFEKTCARFELFGARVDAITGKPCESGPKVGPPPGVNIHGGKSYSADRATLRKVLMNGIEDSIQFGKIFKHYTHLDNGQVQVEFTDGTTEIGNIIVGSDGRGSKVCRQLLPDYRPLDLGVRVIYGKTPISEEFNARYPDEYTRGMSTINDKDGPATIFYETMKWDVDPAISSGGLVDSVKDYVYWVYINRNFKRSDSELFSLSKDQIYDMTLELTKQWDPRIRSMLELQDIDQAAVLLITSAPLEIPNWTSSNVTLIGDAVHAMVPIGGAGANTTLLDVATLCECLKNGLTVENIAKYEEEMRIYASKYVTQGYEGALRVGFSCKIEDAQPLNY